MKRSLLLFLLLIIRSYAQSPSPLPSSEQVIAGPFNWKTDLSTLRDLSASLQAGLTIDNGAYDDFTLDLVSTGKAPVVYTLRTLGSAVVSQISSKHYAIVGRLRYAGMAPGSFLEMESWFRPEQPGGPEGFFFSRTLGNAGPMAKIEGSDDGRDFVLPFDATGFKTSLDRLVLKLHIMGPGEIWLSNVRLVQYPDATAATSVTAPPAVRADRTNSLPPKDELDGRSFALGMLAAFAAVLFGRGLLTLGRRFRGLRHARELRRIASLDG
jgi:hypothetical protein